MRRLWKVAAVATMIGASGCGTILNLTDIDDKGREPYGGYHRDVAFFWDWGSGSSSYHPLSGNCGKGGIVLLALIPAVFVAYIGCGATETGLSLLGDACTAPIIPFLDHLSGYDALPSVNPKAAARVAATMPAPMPPGLVEEPATHEPAHANPLTDDVPAEKEWYKTEVALPTEVSLPPILGLKRYFEPDLPKLSELPALEFTP